MSLQVEVMIAGRRTASIEVYREFTGDDAAHDYAWSVHAGGRLRRGTVTHREERGDLSLLYRVLRAYLTSIGGETS